MPSTNWFSPRRCILLVFCLCVMVFVMRELTNYRIVRYEDAVPRPTPAPYRPPTGKPLCNNWDDNLFRSKNWWDLACLIERKMDGNKEYICKHLKVMALYPVCWDEPYRPRDPCLVYSFGSNNEWGFDDSMAAEGCTVYTFDPNMGKPDHKHSERVFFKNLGLGTVDTDTFEPFLDIYVIKKTTWKIRTLKSIMTMLGHLNRTIDVLKMDIEVYEWDVVANIMKDNLWPQIRQFQIEWHIFAKRPPRDKFQDIYNTFMDLRKHGLHFYHSQRRQRWHQSLETFNTQGDMSYVNTKFRGPK